MILVDSDVLVDFLRKDPKAAVWFTSLSTPISVPGFVAMELKQGCRDKRELLVVQRFLAKTEVVWPSPARLEEASDLYGPAKLSHGLGLIDALIGATALEHGAVLYTFNVRHFAGMPGVDVRRPY